MRDRLLMQLSFNSIRYVDVTKNNNGDNASSDDQDDRMSTTTRTNESRFQRTCLMQKL